jgi:VWFA-related protein
MDNMRRILALSLLLSLRLSAQSPAGSAAQPPTTLHVESQLVILDITVMDASGKPVTDLRPDEFRITEKSDPQTIMTFEPPAAHTLPPAYAGKVIVNSSADLPKIGASPVTLLVLDELNMNFSDRAFARTRMIDWLKRQSEVLAQPTALLAINEKDLHVLRDYTQSRAALLDVMNKHTGDVVWRINDDSTSLSAQQNMGAVLNAIDHLAQATRGIPGRKNIIWVGRGFPAIQVSDVGASSADAVNAQLRYLSDLLLKAHVTLNVVGPLLSASQANLFSSTLGQSGTVDTNMSQFDNDSGALKFFALATSSGGHNFTARNDIDAEIERSVDEGSSFYTISYRPTTVSNDPNSYRKISVQVTRPGLTVQTRDGYFAAPQQPNLSPRETTEQIASDLNSAATSTIPYSDLHLKAVRTGLTDYTLHASAGDLTWRDLPDGRRRADVILMAICISSRGKLLARNYTPLGSNTDASLAAIGLASAALPMHVSAPAGTAHIRFVVRDMVSGRIGTTDVTP